MKYFFYNLIFTIHYSVPPAVKIIYGDEFSMKFSGDFCKSLIFLFSVFFFIKKFWKKFLDQIWEGQICLNSEITKSKILKISGFFSNFLIPKKIILGNFPDFFNQKYIFFSARKIWKTIFPPKNRARNFWKIPQHHLKNF